MKTLNKGLITNKGSILLLALATLIAKPISQFELAWIKDNTIFKCSEPPE